MVSYLQQTNKPALAYHYTQPAQPDAPTLIFCGGYRSDMEGTKATFLEQKAKDAGYGYLRFDYSGHGQSEGNFDDLILSDWIADTLTLIDTLIKGPYILIGSSMGGWIGLRVMLEQANKNKPPSGYIGIAAAPDFTEDLFELRLSPDQQTNLMNTGIAYIENDYSDTPYSFTKAFYEDGKTNLVLRQKHTPPCPVHLVQGRLDNDVPWQTATKIQHAFAVPQGNITLIDDGDHRLSRPADLDIIWKTAQKIAGQL